MATTNQQIKDLVEDPSRLTKLDPRYRKYIIDRINQALDFQTEFVDKIGDMKKRFNEISNETKALINRYATLSPPPTDKAKNKEEIYLLNIYSFINTIQENTLSSFDIENYIKMLVDFKDTLQIMCLSASAGQLCMFCHFECPYRKKYSDDEKEYMIKKMDISKEDAEKAIW